MHHSLLRLTAASFALFAAVTATPSAAVAQCTYTLPASTFAGGANESVLAMAARNDGSTVVGGRFTSIGGVSCNRIARWDGSSFAPLGTGTDGEVAAMLTLPNGDLILGGNFFQAGGVPAIHIARWDGSTFSAIGGGIDPLVPFGSAVQAIVALPNGNLVVAGTFQTIGGTTMNNIARWDGSSWNALGTGINGPVRGLTVTLAGDVIATGSFTQAGGGAAAGIARWDGASWNALGTGLGVFGGTTVATMANGDLVVGGTFVTAGGLSANRIARWNGASWSALGSGVGGVVSALLPLPNGELLVGGLFTTAGGLPSNRIARWNGSAWSTFGTGFNAGVQELLLAGNGSVVVGGDFATANGSPAARIASLGSSCAPTVVDLGGGCTGSGGPNVLAATKLPLVGGEFRSLATGMPSSGAIVVAIGFTLTSQPLNAVLPFALPGCIGTNSAEIQVFLPAAPSGQFEVGFPVANTPSLAGAWFAIQVAPVELDVNFDPVTLTSTNGLQVTVGTF